MTEPLSPRPAFRPAIAGCPLPTTVSPLTRRRFLSFTGVAAAGAIAAGSTQVGWSDLVAAAAEAPLDPDAGVLVVVTLYGGNDGLNTVVPASDPVYQRARAELAYRADEVLDLGEGLGLNPGMKGLHGLWGSKQLAIVRGVGYPEPDHSHFRSMAIWQTASPKTASTTGWLGRWLDATTTNPLLAVSIDTTLPPMLAGARLAAASFPVTGLRLPANPLGRAMKLLAKPSSVDGAWQAKVARSLADLQTAAKVLGPAGAQSGSDPDPGDEPTDVGASAGGQSGLGAQLDTVATLIEMGVPTRVYSVSLGGFDTHSDERGTQQRLLAELDAALVKFQQRLTTTQRGGQVTTMIYSEFGRRVTANASDGTDHGTAGPVLVLGRGVRGGFFGTEPSLTGLDAGDLVATTDFRSVYSSLLQNVLDTDPGRVLAGYSGTVDHLFG